MRAMLFGLFTCNALLCAAEQTQLDNVVVTGTRTEETLLDVPVRTEVIDSQTLQSRHVQDAADALDLLGGLYVKASHGKEGQEVWMQGFNSDRILILIDGRRPVASTGATVDLTQISVENIERIEVVKGATSALYGTAAMGGVINIITKKNRDPLHVSFDALGGSWLKRAVEEPSYTRIAGSIQMKEALYELSLAADRRDDKGFAYDPDSFEQEGQAVERDNLKLNAAWTPGAHRIYVEAEYFDESKYRPSLTLTPGVGYLEQVYGEEVESLALGLGGEHPLGEERLRWRLWYQEYDSTSDNDIRVTPFVEDRRRADIVYEGGEAQYDTALGEAHLLSMGAMWHQESLDQTKSKGSSSGIVTTDELGDDASRHNLEAYLQDSWMLGEDAELLPGVRYQDDSDFGGHLAPKINAMMHLLRSPLHVTLRGGVGTGYRIPTLKERYYSFDQSQHGYQVIGNPDLQPETSLSYQAGIEAVFESGSALGLNLFYNDIDKLIDTRYNEEATLQSGLDTYDYQNIGSAVTQGVEFTASWALEQTQFKGAYTYLHTKDDTTGLKLTQRPEHQFKGSIEQRIGDLLAVFVMQAQSEEYVDEENAHTSPGYALYDFKLTYEPNKTWRLYGGCDNLFDLHRNVDSAYDLRPKTGRFAYIGMTINFISKD